VESTSRNSVNLPRGRARTPTVIQMENVECGAAALGIILGYFGRIVPLAELRRSCGVSRDGSKASNIVRAAALYGLKAKGFKKEIADLKDVRYPYVVFWNFNHFLVVEGYRNGRVYLNDPATGPRSVTIDEFDEAYTGVVLVMEPSDKFQKGGRQPALAPALWHRLRGSIWGVVACSIAALFLVIPSLTAAALTRAFIDNVVMKGMQGWVRPIVLGLLATAFIKVVLTQTQLRVLRQVRLKLSVVMTSRFVWHLLHLPASYYLQRYSGEIASRITLNDKVAEALSGRLATTGTDILIMFAYAVVMFRFDSDLTLIAMAFALANFGILKFVSRTRRDQNARLAHDVGKQYAVSISGLRSIRTLKASALESEFFARWAGFYSKAANTQQQFAGTSQYLALMPKFLSFVMAILILAIGGLRVMDGMLTIGMLVAFQTLAVSFLTPVNNLMQLGGQLQELQSDVTRLDDVLQNPGVPEASIKEWDRNQGPVRLEGHLELRDVTFSYNPASAVPLISNLSLTLKPGQRVALVGSSGSGKSTVAKLICGTFDPTGGEILFDGRPRREIPRSVLSNSVAAVDQDIVLFGVTVRENLTLWDATAPDDQVEAACRDALIHESILNLPHAYESRLAEDASNLSGGQRQRLEIARALAANPSILVLDEATSALDAETEKFIDAQIKRRRCTCVIVSHRLSTIRDCDEILVLEAGNVVERGTHDQLLHEGGLYSQLLFDEGAFSEEGVLDEA
jgi:ATP-binding cassette, subfamily C, bacterial